MGERLEKRRFECLKPAGSDTRHKHCYITFFAYQTPVVTAGVVGTDDDLAGSRVRC
jgi:hypothetical protein